MNRKHLLYHVFDTVEPGTIEDLIDALQFNKAKFSDDPQAGELSVAAALIERYDA